MPDPILVRGPLSGRVYIATKYTINNLEKGHITAHTKYDVTEDFMALAREICKEEQAKQS